MTIEYHPWPMPVKSPNNSYTSSLSDYIKAEAERLPGGTAAKVLKITTNAAIQANQQPISTNTASNHYDRSVVIDTINSNLSVEGSKRQSTNDLSNGSLVSQFADEDTVTRADKIRAVAQQAHDNGDCVCCLPDPDTITITISREDAEYWAEHYSGTDPWGPWGHAIRLEIACRAALEGEK